MRMSVPLEAIERRPAWTFLAVGLLFAVTYVAVLGFFPRSHGRILDGDAIQYYAYLRSLVLDGDVDFGNDYQLLYRPADADAARDNVWLREVSAAGRPTNLMSIGPALLWAPVFLLVYAAVAALGVVGVSVPLDGVAAPFQLAAGVAGVAYAAAGSYFSYRACRVVYTQGPSCWGALTAWLATPAIYYSLVSPAYSHAVSFFASALFCWAWLSTRGDQRIGRAVKLGVLAGLVALVRWQDAVVLALPAVELVTEVVRKRQRVSRAALLVTVIAGVAAVTFLPQLMAWRAIYGQFLLMPQGGDFMRWTTPALGSVLFSLHHGLFTWTPAVLLAIAGLPVLIRRNAVVGWSVVLVLAATVYVNGSVSDWWAGEAFGARRFVGATVFFALGLAGFFDSRFWRARPRLLRWAAAGAIAYNALFLLQYQLFMRGFTQIVGYPTSAREVLFDRLTLPYELVRAWLSRS
jgi:hypothetical protein